MSNYDWDLDFSILKGKTFNKVERREDSVSFYGEENFCLFHSQECCESVWVEDVNGDLHDLENSEILLAEHTMVEGPFNDGKYHDDLCESHWYKLATIKGYVTIRFNGESNGYYSVNATLQKA